MYTIFSSLVYDSHNILCNKILELRQLVPKLIFSFHLTDF